MLKLDYNYKVLSSKNTYIRTKSNQDKILIFEKENLVFVFNWHPDQSY